MRQARLLSLVLTFVGAACVYDVRERDLLPGARLRRSVAGTEHTSLSVTMPDGAVLRGEAFTTPENGVVVVYFGGNGEIIGPGSSIGALARRHHFDAYAVNYRGFGPSDGVASFNAIQSDDLPAFDAIAARPEVRGRPIIVCGFSLGAASALGVATRRPVAGIIVIGVPSAAAEVIPAMRHALPWYWRPFIRLRAAPEVATRRPQPIDLAPQVTAPLLVIHASRDRVVAPRFGEEIFKAAGSADKTFCRIDGADHDDLWRVGGEKPHQCIDTFLARIAATTPAR